MRYTNLTGLKFKTNGLKYLYEDWGVGESLSQFSGEIGAEIQKHQICEREGSLLGVECIYVLSSGGKHFIFPISELEQSNQIPVEFLKSEVYEIY
jgi:hypothetical protein